MALDGIILGKVKDALQEKLPMRINRISEISSTEIVFNVHAENTRCSLVISCHSVYNRIVLSDRNYSSYDNPGGFVMLLRKYLLNGVIYQIDQQDHDRYLLLHIRARDELYDERHFLLSAELMGKYANLILVDEDTGRIMDALKRIPPFENSRRTILSGALFQPVEAQDKEDPYQAQSVEEEESLVKRFSGFSRLLENEVRYRLQQETFPQIMQEIADSDSLYISEVNGKSEYHVIPLRHLGVEAKRYPLFEGFEKIYFDQEEKDRIRDLSADLFRFARRQSKHFAAKITKLQESYEEALHLSEDREKGELLFTYGDLQRKGLSELELTGYDGEPLKISLNPKLSVKENANKYFQSYHKKRKGQEYISEQLQLARMEEEYFRGIEEQLAMANAADAADIREELVRGGYLKAQKVRNPKKKKVRKIPLYRLQCRGHTITFGKNNLQNDHLTFHVARPNDLWFHAKDYHGSHLIVDDPDPDEETLRLCACLAAYFSQGRFSSSVPVDYCPVKEVKKVKGGKTGFVTLKAHKTIYIDPELDPSLHIVSI